jgi:hypothetical protein
MVAKVGIAILSDLELMSVTPRHYLVATRSNCNGVVVDERTLYSTTNNSISQVGIR